MNGLNGDNMIVYSYGTPNGYYKLYKYPCNGYNDKSKCKDCIHMVCKPENARKYIKEEYGYDIKNNKYKLYIIIGIGIIYILSLILII